MIATNLPPIYIAQNIQTGNASVQSTVQTDIQGSGSVSTHIEVSANGEKKVLDTNSPGTYSLQVQSNGNNNSYNSGDNVVTPTLTVSPTTTASPTPTIVEKKSEIHKQSFLLNLKNTIQSFLAKIFNMFKPK